MEQPSLIFNILINLATTRSIFSKTSLDCIKILFILAFIFIAYECGI